MILTDTSRGIPHIEDLPCNQAVKTLQELHNFRITEKIDGAQILFGIDELGFYTSRETKGGRRIYSESDYESRFSTTYMRSAHKVLENNLPLLRAAGMTLGDQVEAEVIYGELPNVVPYSKDTSYIVFLRTTQGRIGISDLKKSLDGHTSSVSLTVPYTNDGQTIEITEVEDIWKFASVPHISVNLVPELVNFYIKEMTDFLSIKDPVTAQTYGSLVDMPLNKRPCWSDSADWSKLKDYIKDKRQTIRDIFLRDHMLPVKEVLLDNWVRNKASMFGPPVQHGGWIEGVVLHDNSSGKMVKLVDKSLFGTVRIQAWAKRNLLTENARNTSGPHSFVGQLMLDMATSTGHPALGTINAKRYLKTLGSTTQERVSAVSKSTNIVLVKPKWLLLLGSKESHLKQDLDKYTEDYRSENEKTYLQSAIYDRTVQSYAEIFQKISLLRYSVTNALVAEDLVVALVGKQLGEI